MNKRQRKKIDKQAINLAKKIIYLVSGYPNGYPTFWECKSETSKNDMKYVSKYYKAARTDFKNELQAKEMLLKVCRKCIFDNFKIQDYCLFEIPYRDANGWIMDFVHMDEYNNYHYKNNENSKIHEIDFWCPYNQKMAIPQGLNNSNQYDCNYCQEAVYND